MESNRQNHQLLLIVLVVGIFIAFLAYRFVQQGIFTPQSNYTESTKSLIQNDVANRQDSNPDLPKEEMMGPVGTYLPFSPEALTSSANTRRVLFFYANWCPTCKPADVSFSQNLAKLPIDVTVIRVNYNDTETDEAEKELAKKYGVTYQHTFVQIDANGNEIQKWNGGKIDELLQNIQ